MGLPAKCTFCGVPGRRGYNTPKLGDVKFILLDFHPPLFGSPARHSCADSPLSRKDRMTSRLFCRGILQP